MNMYGKYFFLFSIFLLSFFSMNIVKYHTHIITKERPQWTNPPIVVNCYITLFPEKRLNDAIDFWENNGNELYLMSTEYIYEACKHEELEGFILIKRAKINKLDIDVLGLTSIKSEFNEIKHATIYLKNGTFYYPNLLEHELGHALGFPHIDVQGNIMNPIYDNTGLDF